MINCISRNLFKTCQLHSTQIFKINFQLRISCCLYVTRSRRSHKQNFFCILRSSFQRFFIRFEDLQWSIKMRTYDSTHPLFTAHSLFCFFHERIAIFIYHVWKSLLPYVYLLLPNVPYLKFHRMIQKMGLASTAPQMKSPFVWKCWLYSNFLWITRSYLTSIVHLINFRLATHL